MFLFFNPSRSMGVYRALGPSSKVNAILGGSSTGSPAVVSVKKFSEAVAFADACFTRESIPGPASEVKELCAFVSRRKEQEKNHA